VKLSVVIPAHNEETCIGRTVRILHAHLSAEQIDHEILVINDNSTDRTEEILVQLKKEIRSFRYLNNGPPHGFGLAVRRGLETYKGDAVAVYMADGSDRPEDLVEFFETLQRKQVDCVFGSRFIRGAKVVNYPVLKLVLNRVGNVFIQLVFGLRYNDVTNAFKLYRRHVIDGLKPFLSPHFNLTVELPLKAIVRGYSYAIVPNDWINRKIGESKFQVQEMGSRYFFIVFYCLIEKWFSSADYLKREPMEETAFEAPNGKQPNFKVVHGKWLILGVFVVCLIWAVFMASAGWNNSLSDDHGFRQTQTAITSYYLMQGGPFLKYEWPVFGAPWSIPFEFPLYQWIVAETATLFHTPLEQTGRFVSELFFGLSLATLWAILSEVGIPPIYRLVFIALVLVSPQYIFWSRTFLIESTALFFCATYLFFVIRFIRTRSAWDAVAGGLFGVCGALVKVTTFPGFAVVGGLLYILSAVRFSDEKDFKSRGDLSSHAVAFLTFACLPILVEWAWVYYTDQVKALNISAVNLTSSAMRKWNWGTLHQRISGETWSVLLFRTLPDVLGSTKVVLFLLLGLFMVRQRALPVLICICGFLSAFLLFTNLHVIHNYYSYANGVFLIAAMSWCIVALLQSKRWHAFLGVAIFLICVLSAIKGYSERFYKTQISNSYKFSELARRIKSVTEPEDVILIFNWDWSPELAYYSQRRALTLRVSSEQDLDAPGNQAAINRLADRRIGALIVCNNARSDLLIQRATSSLNLSTKPEYYDSTCAMYPSLAWNGK
jgi:dolichol-phosphate mannosyltransferase